MKRFLKKLLFFMVPALLLFLTTEYLLRNIPNDYSLKAEVYQEHGKEFETLILGNSYGLYDLDPVWFSTPTFNGAHLIQPLDMDAALFHKYQPIMPKLKNVIIPVSDMSFFFNLETSGQNWRAANYSIYYGLKPSYNIGDYFEIFHLPFSVNRNRLISYYIKKENKIRVSDLGFGNNFSSSYKLNLDSTAKENLRIHKINDLKLLDDEKAAMEKIISTCARKNIRVILLLPPAYSTYAANIDSLQLNITVNTCISFSEKYKNVSFINLLRDSSFSEPDYFDAVHLNEAGAKKLSLKIDSFIKQSGKLY